MGEIIANLIINIPVGLLMIGIGICMKNKKEPTGFYTGEKPHKSEEIKDTKKWNLIHGLMFIIYGILIILFSSLMAFCTSEIAYIILYFVVYLLPLPIMIFIHQYLEKHYVIK